MKKILKNLEAAFIVWCRKNNVTETGWVEMDNLDKAKLVLTDMGWVVRNEHGTEYDGEDLSKVECEVFLYLLATDSI